MLTTNLLPIEDKKTISLIKGVRLSVIGALTVLTLAVSNAVFVLPTLLPLIYEKRGLTRELETGKEGQEKFQASARQSEVRRLSNTTREIRAYISKPQYTSKILIDLAKLENSQIDLSTITLTDTGSFTITGRAATRKALLDLESALKEFPYFRDIASPFSNIIRESNISFTISGKIKEELFK